ncbi:MAG: lipoprotein [Hyphomonadaceae bacterium]
MIRLAAALFVLAALSACGVRGGLERPEPLWGSPEGADRESQQRAAEELERRQQAEQVEPGELSPTIPPLPQ